MTGHGVSWEMSPKVGGNMFKAIEDKILLEGCAMNTCGVIVNLVKA
jgi:hypothetical protein